MRRASLLLVILLSGCVYYNGVYNAKRLAGSAERAEREGRTFDASSFWGQVAVKAESVIARHPHSKWVAEASVLQGEALASIGQCAQAEAPLRNALPTLTDSDQVERASLALGRCELARGEAASALSLLTRVSASRDEYRSGRARLLQARALRIAGHPAEAARILATSRGAEAAGERLVALAAAADSQMLPVVDSFIARRDSLAPWDSVLAVLGARDPIAASRLVDRLHDAGLRETSRPRWLLDDGLRLAERDPLRAEQRLTEAAGISGTAEASAEAAVAAQRMRLRRATTSRQLITVADSLEVGDEPGSATGQEVSAMVAALAIVRSVDTIPAGAPQGDLRLFLAAETVRDALSAPLAASALFRRIITDWPESPYGAKALLAARALDPIGTEPLAPLLQARYASSPYLVALQGIDSPEYRALEDSLGAYASTLTTAQRTRRTRRIRRSPSDTSDVDRSTRARTPAAGNRRPEELP